MSTTTPRTEIVGMTISAITIPDELSGLLVVMFVVMIGVSPKGIDTQIGKSEASSASTNDWGGGGVQLFS